MQLLPCSFGKLAANLEHDYVHQRYLFYHLHNSSPNTTYDKKSEYRVMTDDDAGLSCKAIVAEKVMGKAALAVVPGIKWPLFNLIYKHTVASINILKCFKVALVAS